MPSAEYVELQVLPGLGNGVPRHVGTIFEKTVQVTGPFTGTLQLQGRIGDAGFADLGAPFAAPAFRTVPESVSDMRVVTTVAITAGAARVLILGAH